MVAHGQDAGACEDGCGWQQRVPPKNAHEERRHLGRVAVVHGCAPTKGPQVMWGLRRSERRLCANSRKRASEICRRGQL